MALRFVKSNKKVLSFLDWKVWSRPKSFEKKIKYFSESLWINNGNRGKNCKSLKNIKEALVYLSHTLVQQCQIYGGQRLRNNLRLYLFYSRIWGEEAAQHIFSSIRHSILKKAKCTILSAACLLRYEWDKNIISDEKLKSAVDEFNEVNKLCSDTIVCGCCEKREAIDRKINGIDYCTCKDGKTDTPRQYDNWSPFLERENIIVWRKKHKDYPSLYCYKVYGSYDDMSSAAFMEVQLNEHSRTLWDPSALELSVLDSKPETNSDLIHWIVKFPQFFSNRDYVFVRRFQVDEQKKEIVIISEVANNVAYPEVRSLHRVKEYWSKMVIKSKEGFHKPGMSYTLTYFDNPGMSLPAAVTNYVASTGFPNFLQRVYGRAMEMQVKWENGEDVYTALPLNLRYRPKEKLEIPPEEEPTEIPTKQLVPMPNNHNLDSSQEVSSHLSLSKLIKNLVNGSDKNGDYSIDSEAKNLKIPFRYKGIILDLLEAIEVISPDIKEKDFLINLIDALVGEKDISAANETHTPLWNRVKILRNKVIAALSNVSKKKENSIHKAKDGRDAQSHYLYEQEALEVVTDLFRTMNNVLQADIEQKTGKSILKNEETENISAIPQHTTDSEQNSQPEAEVCECCACQHCYPSSVPSSSSWFPSSFSIKFWSSSDNAVNIDYEQICQRCAEEHHSVNNTNSHRSWWPFSTSSQTPNNNDAEKLQNVDATYPEHSLHLILHSLDCSSNYKDDPNSWYWYPIETSFEMVAWISSLLFTQII